MKLRTWITLLSAAFAISIAASAQATELVTNGDFEQTTKGPAEFNAKTTAVGWSSKGYNFIFAPGTADTTGSKGNSGTVKLWGPNDGSKNGLPASSPTGGNFVAADGAYEVGAITQTIRGLTAGAQYQLGFWWAVAQQSGFTGPTTEQWVVGLGSESHSTPVVHNVNHGFTGWVHETFAYTAQAGSEVLSFLSVGTPTGEPPFALLDGVSMTAVPEPAGWAVLLVGLAAVAWRRRKARTTEPTST